MFQSRRAAKKHYHSTKLKASEEKGSVNLRASFLNKSHPAHINFLLPTAAYRTPARTSLRSYYFLYWRGTTGTGNIIFIIEN